MVVSAAPDKVLEHTISFADDDLLSGKAFACAMPFARQEQMFIESMMTSNFFIST
jgi:hypothetical protein